MQQNVMAFFPMNMAHVNISPTYCIYPLHVSLVLQFHFDIRKFYFIIVKSFITL